MIGLRALLTGCCVIAAYGAGVAWAQTAAPGPAVSAPAPPPIPDPAATPAPSLMFTPDQVAAINKAVDRAPVETLHAGAAGDSVPQAMPVLSLSLSALLFTDPAHWTVWVNGQRLGPGMVGEGYRVVAVSETMVEFEIDGQPQRVRLRPHETYLVGMTPGDNGSIQ